MATVDWKKLEGRIFRFDVNTSTEDALKAENLWGTERSVYESVG